MPVFADLPGWVHWVAQDKSGVWWGFEAEPNQGHDFWYENEVGRCVKLVTAEENRDWKRSLQKVV